MHLEQLPVSHLSLLPLSTRNELLLKLPIADVCQLEDTKFVEGIDLGAFWKFICKDFSGMGDVRAYFSEWDDAKYYRAFLYGEIVTYIIGGEALGGWVSYPHNAELMVDDDIVSFMYSVRKFTDEQATRCQLLYPPRYHQESKLMCNVSDMSEDVVEAAMNCFGGELPKILAGVQLYETDIDFECADGFLSDIVYLGIHGEPFNGRGLEFVNFILKNAAKLEVLILEGLFGGMERISLDELFNLLCVHPTFLSTFQLLEIQPGDYRLFASRPAFDKLITAFFAAFTDHNQKVHFVEVKIEAYDMYDSPDIYERFLDFKNIELDNCRMVSKCKVTPKTISHWLGKAVSAQESNDISGSWVFQVKKNSDRNTRKRKYSETQP